MWLHDATIGMTAKLVPLMRWTSAVGRIRRRLRQRQRHVIIQLLHCSREALLPPVHCARELLELADD